MIELEDVSLSYVVEGRREETVTHVLDDFSLSVPRLQFLAIVGAAGSG